MSQNSRYYRIPASESGDAARSWVVKVVTREQGPIFDAYVGIDDAGRVVERSSGWGRFEGDAEWVTSGGGGIETVSADAFAAAWNAPKVTMSRWTRFKQRMNGVSEVRDPTAR